MSHTYRVKTCDVLRDWAAAPNIPIDWAHYDHDTNDVDEGLVISIAVEPPTYDLDDLPF